MNYKFNNTVKIQIGYGIELSGELAIPDGADSLVLFSHGSGSSRFSPRNNFVAKELHKKNIATFLFDLLTSEEDQIYFNRFNIDMLSERLVQVTKFIAFKKECEGLAIGYFGASTGAASALKAANKLPDLIQAIVLRGGRPDLAINVAPNIKVPTLFIVGEYDYEVLALNKKVFEVLNCEKKLEIVPKATHLFEEEGALENVAVLAGNWFSKYLVMLETF